MRVLITTDVIGGVWNFTLTLVERLRASGCECLVAMIGQPQQEQLDALPADVDHESRDLRLEWMEGADEDVAATADWLDELVRRWRPDVLHLNQFAYAARDYGVPKLVVAHSDVRSWWGEVKGTDADAAWDEYSRRVREGLDGADCVVAPTAYQSGLLARHYGRFADRVIHNGIELGAARGREAPSRRPLIVTAGRAWDEAKSVATLDEALELLGDDAPVAELAGELEGPDGRTYVPRRLLPLGQLTIAQMERLYDNAAMYVATSVYEPFGLAPLEATRHGCALVLSDIGSFRDLWHGCAEFYSAGNPASLAGALRRMFEVPERIDELARLARERAAERYTAGLMAARYQELYATLVEHGGFPRVVRSGIEAAPPAPAPAPEAAS